MRHKRRSCQTPATERLHGKDRALKTRWGSRVAGSHEGSHVCNLVCVCVEHSVVFGQTAALW